MAAIVAIISLPNARIQAPLEIWKSKQLDLYASKLLPWCAPIFRRSPVDGCPRILGKCEGEALYVMLCQRTELGTSCSVTVLNWPWKKRLYKSPEF